MILRARQWQFEFPRPPMVMGILNVTPDSFSDGGRYLDMDRAVAHALEMEAEGADIIDVGGESTRPNSIPTSTEEELRRVAPVLERLSGRIRIPLSIDTRKVEVARVAVAAGATFINDIEAARRSDEMMELAAETSAGYVIMHMRGTPQSMQAEPAYDNVVEEVEAFLRERLLHAIRLGVKLEQLVLDVGIGFGKTLPHNLSLLRSTEKFVAIGRPVLVGVSRKSFMGTLLGLGVAERLPAALACTAYAVSAGASMIRTHDVRETKSALEMLEAIRRAD